VQIAGQPLELDRVYRAVSNNYVRNSGDGYKMFRGRKTPIILALTWRMYWPPLWRQLQIIDPGLKAVLPSNKLCSNGFGRMFCNPRPKNS